jgi:hypothetical protein
LKGAYRFFDTYDSGILIESSGRAVLPWRHDTTT